MPKPLLVTLQDFYKSFFAPLDINELPGIYVKALPDAYLKTLESVNNRILSLPELAMNELHKGIEVVELSADLNCAKASTLNLFGQMVEQPRGKLNDRQYLAVVRAQIACNLSKGDFATVLAAVRMMLDCDNSQVRLIELPNEICAIKVDTIPYEVLVKTGLSTRQIQVLIKRLIPAGVRIEEVLFEGTLEFGETAAEYDENRGFANLAQTIGGYFGAVVGDDENAVSLPI